MLLESSHHVSVIGILTVALSFLVITVWIQLQQEGSSIIVIRRAGEGEEKRKEIASSALASKSSLPPLRVCNKSSYTVPNTAIKIDVEYQCVGHEYNKFTLALSEFSNNVSLHTRTWGRRSIVLPDNAHVLFLGNSHTKQTALELACQYSEQLVKFHTNTTHAPYARLFEYQNNASIFLLFNSPVEIAVDWVGELEKIAQRPVSSFSAVVLGQFNRIGADLVNTNFYKQMVEWSAANKNLQFGKANPPDVIRLSQNFAGPIVFSSSYGVEKQKTALGILKQMKQIRRLSNRTNMQAILSRKYFDGIDHGNECISAARIGESSCRRDPKNMVTHRCVGLKGGHPTLIAHDVQEALFALLRNKNKKNTN